MSRQPSTLLTPGEYLAIERRAEFRSEYIEGEIVAMTGASRRHNLIVANLTGELRQQLKSRPCELYPSDMRIRIPSGKLYTYPDIVVVCGEPQFEDAYVDTLLNPTLIIEVLSESTESYDRGKKFGYYRTLESLREYGLLAQDEYRLEQYVKQADGRWLLSEFKGLEATVKLASIECNLQLTEVYDRVVLDQT
jgi:Uma2 family endonuclease